MVFVLLHDSNFIMETEDAYRGSSTIPPSSKLELLCQYKMTSIVTKSSIIDYLGVRDPPLACLFSVQNITKNIKTYQSEHLHIPSRALEQGVKTIQS